MLQCVAVCCNTQRHACHACCAREHGYGVAACCSVLQGVPFCRSVLRHARHACCARAHGQGVAASCSVFQRVAACCSVLDCVAVCCPMQRHTHHTATQSNKRQHIATHYNTTTHCPMQRHAHHTCCSGCCSVLQCVAVCCSVLQCVAVCSDIRIIPVVLEHIAEVLQHVVAISACCSVLPRREKQLNTTTFYNTLCCSAATQVFVLSLSLERMFEISVLKSPLTAKISLKKHFLADVPRNCGYQWYLLVAPHSYV